MASQCSGLDFETMEQARVYYEELLATAVHWYNEWFHSFVYQFLCIVGVLANVCIVVVLLRPSMRKNPFNLFLIAIAICDMTLMASYFAFKAVEMCHPWFFEFAWIVFTYAYAVLSVFIHSVSLWITVNMAVLRYLVLRGSASSAATSLNSYTAASVSIAAAVLISLVGSVPNALRYRIRDNGQLAVPRMCLANGSRYAGYYHEGAQVHAYMLGQPEWWSCSWERFSFWTAGLLLKLVPCVLLTIFMTLLVRMLIEARERRQRLCRPSNPPTVTCESRPQPTLASTTVASNCEHWKSQPNSTLSPSPTVTTGFHHQYAPSSTSITTSKSQAERTTAMLTIIVAVFLITELPQGLLVLAIGVRPEVMFAMHQLGNMLDLLSLLNSSVNFILYSTMSNLFRHEFLETFGGSQLWRRLFSPTRPSSTNRQNSQRESTRSNRENNCVHQTATNRPRFFGLANGLVEWWRRWWPKSPESRATRRWGREKNGHDDSGDGDAALIPLRGRKENGKEGAGWRDEKITRLNMMNNHSTTMNTTVISSPNTTISLTPTCGLLQLSVATATPSPSPDNVDWEEEEKSYLDEDKV